MNILMVCDVQGNLGDAIRISRIADAIAKKHTLRICNIADYRLPKRNLIQRPSVLKDFILHSVKGYTTAKYEAYRTLMEEVLDEQLRAFRPNVVVVEGVLQAGLLAEECKVPMVTDVHGIASAEYSENPFNNVKTRKTDYFKKAEEAAFKRSAAIWAVSEPMKDYITRNGGREQNIQVVRNGADPSKATAKYRESLGVVYGGIMAFWEDIDSFLDLAKTDYKDGFEYSFHIAGGGPLLKHVERRIRKETIPVENHGHLARNETLELFAQMNVGIAPSVDTVTRQVACPIKVFEYMACGLPVITPMVGEWSEIIQDEECGIVTRRSRADEFAAALEELSDEKAWKKASANAVEAIREKYSWKSVLEPINESLEEAAKGI